MSRIRKGVLCASAKSNPEASNILDWNEKKVAIAVKRAMKKLSHSSFLEGGACMRNNLKRLLESR